MIKLILLFVFCAVFALAQGDNKGVSPSSYYSNTAGHSDDYIKLNRLQYAKNLQTYDSKLKHFIVHYSGRLDGINVQLKMVADTIVQNEERLNPLESLSDLSKICISKYGFSVPSVPETKRATNVCVSKASNELRNLLSGPHLTRNMLQQYYDRTFEQQLDRCAHLHANTLQYNPCVTDVTNKANDYTIQNQKTFETQMDAADCAANAYVKSALDCSYDVLSKAISRIAESDLLINYCLEGKDECEPCGNGFTCDHFTYVHKEDVNNATIHNPFYGRQNHGDCLLLKLS